jgi:hypothetical protein
MPPLHELIETVAGLDELLRPIAERPIDINDPNWASRMAASDPLAEAGIKTEAHAALRDLLGHYAEGDDETRQAVRAAFARYRAFRWAVHIPQDPTPAGFRFGLLHFSASDQEADPRDALLTLWDLVARARAGGVDVEPALIEIAELSSDVDRYGMGSTRQMLLTRAHG